MEKNNRIFVIAVILMAAITALYVYAVILQRAVLGGAMSVLISALAGGLILSSYIKNREKKYALLLLALSFAGFSWFAGDIIMAVQYFQGRGAAPNVLRSVVFLLPNILFTASALIFGHAKFNKWRSVKGIIEAVTIGALCIIFVGLVFFNKGDAAIRLLTSDGIISTISIVIDVFLCIEIAVVFLTDDRRKMPVYLLLFIAGVLMFSVNDIIYYVTVYEKTYTLNNISDFLYCMAFLLLASGALWLLLKSETGKSYISQEPREDTGKSRGLYLLIFPAVTVAVGSAKAMDLLIYAVIIGLYQAAMRYIQIASENEELYTKQFNINERLEKQLQEQLAEMTVLANQDTITKLNNRRSFTSCLKETADALKSGEKLAVLLFDIDRFKTINDSCGHDVGDKVIQEIANRLLEWYPEGAGLARLGGDEFAVHLRGNLTRDELSEYCRQLIERCASPIFVDNQVLYVTISIGVSICPDDACDSITLLKNSDISMYKAKAEGFNRYVFYSPLFKENITRKNEIEALLRKADLEKDFEVVFQPQFDLPDLRLIGAEALVRWKSQEHGYIPPSVFVPVAEEINFISKIGKWVLAKAVDQIVAWNSTYGIQLKMGINISPKQLTEDDFFMTLKTLLMSNSVNTSWIDAEITENLMIEENTKVKPIFDLFEELGISVSIDDFGSGYSSLGYLNKYRFDRIKIDKSLVDSLLTPGGNGAEVVKAIIQLAEAVGKTTIAEGVEQEEQLNVLMQLGCRQVQGYLLGKPVSSAIFEKSFIEKDMEKKDKKPKKVDENKA